MRCASETSRNSAAVAVEAPGPALLDDFEAGLVVAVEQLVRDLAGGRLVGELEGLGAEPLHADDGDEPVRQDAADGGVGLEVFEAAHFAFARYRRSPTLALLLVGHPRGMATLSPRVTRRAVTGRRPSLQPLGRSAATMATTGLPYLAPARPRSAAGANSQSADDRAPG